MARMRPHLLAVMQELINLTNEAEVDDLADVMQELVTRYRFLFLFCPLLPFVASHSFLDSSPSPFAPHVSVARPLSLISLPPVVSRNMSSFSSFCLLNMPTLTPRIATKHTHSIPSAHLSLHLIPTPIRRYGPDLGTVAIQISAQLTQTFVRMVVESGDADSEEDINKSMVCVCVCVCVWRSVFVIHLLGRTPTCMNEHAKPAHSSVSSGRIQASTHD